MLPRLNRHTVKIKLDALQRLVCLTLVLLLSLNSFSWAGLPFLSSCDGKCCSSTWTKTGPHPHQLRAVKGCRGCCSEKQGRPCNFSERKATGLAEHAPLPVRSIRWSIPLAEIDAETGHFFNSFSNISIPSNPGVIPGKNVPLYLQQRSLLI